MARDIVLKDGSGNPVVYSGVDLLKVPCRDGNGNVTARKFAPFAGMHAYIVSSPDNGVTYKVEASLYPWTGDNGLLFEFSSQQGEEFGYPTSGGGYKLMAILSASTMAVGQTFALADLLL